MLPQCLDKNYLNCEKNIDATHPAIIIVEVEMRIDELSKLRKKYRRQTSIVIVDVLLIYM